MVVINGPEATAGSIFNFKNKNGTIVPTQEDMVIDIIKATETIPEALIAS